MKTSAPTAVAPENNTLDTLARNMTADQRASHNATVRRRFQSGQPEKKRQVSPFGWPPGLNPRRKSRRYEGYQQAGWGWNSKVVNRMKNYGIPYNRAYKEITKRLPDHKATAEEIEFTIDAFGSKYSPEELESSVSNLRSARHYPKEDNSRKRPSRGK